MDVSGSLTMEIRNEQEVVIKTVPGPGGKLKNQCSARRAWNAEGARAGLLRSMLFRHSAKSLITQEQRISISLSVTRLHLPHAIVVILTPKTVGTLAFEKLPIFVDRSFHPGRNHEF